MRPIILLPEEVANKIAAGEVIERPASVVKELIENSIDAGSRNIEVEIRDGGKEYIRVTDDGEGIPPEYVPLAFERHATSKIVGAQDLFAITTLGFRGEALPSIASVSRLQMLTRTPGADAGTEILLEGGKREAVQPAGCPQGTTVIVRNLFFNTPARYKFLKQSSTERGYVIEVVSNIALANPHISFRLVSEGRPVVTTPGNGDLLDAIAAVMNRTTARAMFPVNFRRDGIEITGFVANPELTRGTRKEEVIVVNGRPVDSRMIASAIEKGYQGFLPPKRFPVAVVHIRIEPPALDVNVHPAKSEVRFADDSKMYRSVMAAVKSALLAAKPVPKIGSSPPVEDTYPGGADPTRRDLQGRDFRENSQESFQLEADVSLGEKRPAFSVGKMFIGPESAPVQDPSTRKLRLSPEHSKHMTRPVQTPPEPTRPPLFDSATILGQVANTYIALATPGGLLLVDQHVAHERVLYEQFASRRGSEHSQPLLVPLQVEVSAQQAAAIEENALELEGLGLTIEPFGPGTVILRSLPVNFRLAQTEKDVSELIEELAEVFSDAKGMRDRLWVMMSCRGAIKANTPLTVAQMERLLLDLSRCENPYRCPHGRPIMVTIDLHEIARRFGRE